jgi:hypothetical protein
MDPVTIIAGGAAAFQALKQGIAVGKDLQDMGGQLSKWAGAMADLDFVERRNQNPPWYKALGGGIEADAMAIFAAREKARGMRQELKEYISVMYGPSKWTEILEIEASLRKQKKEHEYRKIELKQTLIEWIVGILVASICMGLLFTFVWIGSR